MTEQKFKQRAEEVTESYEIDKLCLDWLEGMAREQAPRVRVLMLHVLDGIRESLE